MHVCIALLGSQGCHDGRAPHLLKASLQDVLIVRYLFVVLCITILCKAFRDGIVVRDLYNASKYKYLYAMFDHIGLEMVRN